MSVKNLREVQTRIRNVGESYRLASYQSNASVIAVSKTHPTESIQPLLEAGHRLFGENKVQEAAQKWPDLKAIYDDVELHLIGSLQTNKVKQAVELFDVIETLDRPNLAHSLRKEYDRVGKEVPCFIQVNIGEEPQKSGVSIDELPAFIALARDTLTLPIKGLMCIPPVDKESGPYFAYMQKLATRHNLPCLNMGMSSDYLLAAGMGASYVRVGSAIFGQRQS